MVCGGQDPIRWLKNRSEGRSQHWVLGENAMQLPRASGQNGVGKLSSFCRRSEPGGGTRRLQAQQLALCLSQPCLTGTLWNSICSPPSGLPVVPSSSSKTGRNNPSSLHSYPTHNIYTNSIPETLRHYCPSRSPSYLPASGPPTAKVDCLSHIS